VSDLAKNKGQQKRDVMPITESAPRRLVLRAGSATLTLDKDLHKATFRRKFPNVERQARGGTSFRDNPSQG
jgi:hypothetical protein